MKRSTLMNKLFLGESVPELKEIESVVPVYTGGGGYGFFGRVKTKDGETYPFMADMDYEDICLFDTDPLSHPLMESDCVWDVEWQRRHLVAEYCESIRGFLIELCQYVVENHKTVRKHEMSNYNLDDITRLIFSYMEAAKLEAMACSEL